MTTESQIEQSLISKLSDLKYTYRPDIRDRAALEANFREKFQALNRVHLTDGEFLRLLDQIVSPDTLADAPEKLGKTYADRNAKLCTIITKIAEGLAEFSTDSDTLGDAYEYLIGQFAAGSGKKAGEFYTPQRISDILSAHRHARQPGARRPASGSSSTSVMDFACGSGSLLLNVRKRMGPHGIGKIYGQEKNITTYNLARMNMLLHGVKDSEFEIYHGDTLTNDWDMLRETNPAKKPYFDAVVANPPFSYRWDPNEALGEDVRFKNYGLAPEVGGRLRVPAARVSLPQGRRRDGDHPAARRAVPWRRGGDDPHASCSTTGTSTPSSACRRICSTRPASRSASSCSRSARSPMTCCSSTPPSTSRRASGRTICSDEHIEKIVDTYQHRKEEERYARRVAMEEIEERLQPEHLALCQHRRAGGGGRPPSRERATGGFGSEHRGDDQEAQRLSRRAWAALVASWKALARCGSPS